MGMVVWYRKRITSRGPRGAGRLALLALALALVMLLAACGVTTSSPGGVSGGGTPTSAPTPAATSAGTPRSTTIPASEVTLRTDQTAYKASSTIIVTLTNHRSTSIFAFDHQTSCTILNLQRQTASGWENTGGCALGRVTQRIEIKAGATMKITLAPDAGQIRATPWPAGTYHAVLRYFLPGQDMGAAGTTVTTPTFTIG